MRMFSIASGSSGNSSYIGSENTHILVDVGITAKRIGEGLNKADLDIKDIDAILITHEHIDHIRAVGVLARKYAIPMYTSKGTIEGIRASSCLGDFDYELLNELEADKDFMIGDIGVKAFNINHDANETFGYRFSGKGKNLAVATDIGSYSDYTLENLRNLDALLIEANHDVKMLETGPYTYDLKRRILGDFGHLSNENSGRLICGILNDKIKRIYLGHLSSENNYPDLALASVKCEIDISDCSYKSKDFNIEVAPKNDISGIVEI